MKPERIPPLHVVTDDAVIARPDFVERAGAVLEAGGPELVFHLRAPTAPGRRVFDLARALVPLAIDAESWLVVNDRVDVALAAADGAHVGARGPAPGDARRLLGPGRLLGVSVHSADEAREALEGEPDFLFAGSIWATPSHSERAPAGTGLIGES
ncbi:MAG TPA: thiamine phosphate synthase, partial [Longimicrobium sp.]|nr:thiamine phosphate synthase [Longimicrobium sp.]